MLSEYPWFPKYLSYNKDNKIRTYVLHKLYDSHKAAYWICDSDKTITIHYDGFEYYHLNKNHYVYGFNQDNESYVEIEQKIQLSLYPSNPIEFLQNNQYGKSETTKRYYINAWNDVLENDPNAGKQKISYFGSSLYHKEIYNKTNKFLLWNNIVKPDHFPTYIKLSKDNILVLNKVLNENSAYYWKCSGEWGCRIDYYNNIYSKKDLNDNTSCTIITNPVEIISATPEEFIENNSIFAIDNTKKYYEIAWERIKNENWFANTIKYECNGTYKYVICEYNIPIFKNWSI